MPAGNTQTTREANAKPTKRLLVDVLTKDIDLVAAVLDLIDNSVDGARRLRPVGSLGGLSIEVHLGKSGFSIIDNCGGISLDDAVNRAFAFGPDDDDPPDPYSTGQFGVGMKRALFKMGRKFTVTSSTRHDRFVLKLDINDWLDDPDDWAFPLTGIKTGLDVAETRRGTTIEVKPLLAPIAREMARPAFVSDLQTQTAKRHQPSVARGLSIVIAGKKLSAKAPTVVADDKITPAVVKTSLNGAAEHVDVKVVCGVLKGAAQDAGWSVFLNDRAVLLADRSEATGWGERDDARIPRFHPQYNRFRGFAFLACQDTTRLPWNTTKTGLDRDDAIYREVRAVMVDAADPVVDFLDAVKSEGADEFNTLREAVDKGKTKSVFVLAEGDPQAWHAPPAMPPPPAEHTTRVYTDQPVELVEEAKDFFEVSSNRELGDRLFEYFVEREL